MKFRHERNVDMRASDGLVVTLAVCVLAGIGVLGCNGVNGAGRIHKGIQAAGDNAQKLSLIHI